MNNNTTINKIELVTVIRDGETKIDVKNSDVTSGTLNNVNLY